MEQFFEQMYGFLSGRIRPMNQALLAYVAGTIFNVVSAGFDTFTAFAVSLLNFKNFSIVLMWVAIVLLIIVDALIWPRAKKAFHHSKKSFRIKQIIDENMDDCFVNVPQQAGYAWGKDRSILVAPNIFEGYHPHDIIVEKYDATLYEFDEPKLKEEFDNYRSSEEAKTIVRKGNNNYRYMVNGFETNFHKTDHRIYLSMKKTDWLTLNCFWRTYKSEDLLQQQTRINDLYTKKRIPPNSFCMHMVLMTKDDEVVVTAISKNKSNDYPLSWAVTIGEQIEDTDFNNGADMARDFITAWAKRALLEEFGLYEDQFDSIIPEDGIRVLSLNAEGDICNISMMTVVHMNVSFKQFVEEITLHPEIDKEFTRVDILPIKDIPALLARTDENRNYLHPSSGLRFFLTYLHRYGIQSFVSEYDRAKAEPSERTFFYNR